MASRTSDLLGQVHPNHDFDMDALIRYCSAYVEGFPLSPSKFALSQVSSSSSLSVYFFAIDFENSFFNYVLY